MGRGRPISSALRALGVSGSGHPGVSWHHRPHHIWGSSAIQEQNRKPRSMPGRAGTTCRGGGTGASGQESSPTPSPSSAWSSWPSTGMVFVTSWLPEQRAWGHASMDTSLGGLRRQQPDHSAGLLCASSCPAGRAPCSHFSQLVTPREGGVTAPRQAACSAAASAARHCLPVLPVSVPHGPSSAWLGRCLSCLFSGVQVWGGSFAVSSSLPGTG